MICLVSNTDRRWFDFLAKNARGRGGQLDEVNFWRPRNQKQLRSIRPGAPFFFRLKAPVHAVAGYGFFAHWQLVPIALAWDLFGEKNGDPSFEAFRNRIASYRGSDPSAPDALPLGCIVLRDVVFLAPEEWIPWGPSQDWGLHIVADRRYDLARQPGSVLESLLHGHRSRPPDLAERFELVHCDERRWREQVRPVREGQGTFRLRLLDAYGSRCAVTGKRVVPVLEAAHIQDYFGPASNHVQNGLLLRSDLHHLYDDGYVTVTPDYTMCVSERIRAEYRNGDDYYALHGRSVRLPENPAWYPSREALAWHQECKFS